MQDKMIHEQLLLGCQDYEAQVQLFCEKECALAKVVNIKSEQSQSIAVKHITEDVTDGKSVNTVKANTHLPKPN